MPSLGKDLAEVRNKKGLNIEDVQQITKVPPHILRSIEDDSIFSQIGQNTTYVRSYVRSYAKAIGIEEARIVHALDQIEAGTYNGSLGQPADTYEEPTGKTDDSEPDDSSIADDMVHDHSPEPSSKEKKPPTPSRQDNASSNMVSSVDWVDVGRKANPVKSKSRVWSGLLIIVLVVAVLAAIFLLYNYYYTGTAEEPPTQEEVSTVKPESPSDSLRDALITDETESAQADIPPVEQGVLSDTLSISVYAASGKLEPVRIYTDILGKQNPYWVAEGDTIRFNFVNMVRVRAVNQYDRMQLLFNGHVIQNYYQQYFNAESGMIELDRTVFEDNPQWRSPASNPAP